MLFQRFRARRRKRREGEGLRGLDGNGGSVNANNVFFLDLYRWIVGKATSCGEHA